MVESGLTTKDLAKLHSTAERMDSLWAPCRYHCPVHADVRAYIEAIAQGRFGRAVDIIRRHLPFASVCGRICHHPCEANCRRRDVDEAVAIRELKRFVSELQGAAGATVHKAPTQDKAAVAIVGSGPAGLSAALVLAQRGYRPTVFEKLPRAGGIPMSAVPPYRLPREALQIDIDWILAHGVRVVTGVQIGKDRSIDELLGEGFAAVVVAAGLSRSRMLPLPGADHPRVYPVLEFLQSLAFGPPAEVGDDVLVIGGGNVAVDAARSAVRLGAGRVRMMCLETREEMPAWDWEQREALEEGVEFLHRRGPTEVVVRDGRIVAVRARGVRRVFDDAKRFSPTYDDSDVIELPCDTVVMAIGQMADLTFAAGSGLKIGAEGRLECSPATAQTSRPEVFACGEIVTPPGSVVEACASGRRAAAAVDLYLTGQPIVLDDSLPPLIEQIDARTAEKVIRAPRAPVPTDPPEARRRSMAPFDGTLGEPAAMAESRRCMSCGAGAEVLVDKCAACLVCARVCPFDVPKVTDVSRIDPALCQACGVCIVECPAGAIIPRGWDADRLRKQTEQALADSPGAAVAYVCGQHACAEEWLGRRPSVGGAREIHVASVAGIGVLDLLRAFELGAARVIVRACADGQDRYPGANARLRARLEQARTLLAEAGLDRNLLEYQEMAEVRSSA